MRLLHPRQWGACWLGCVIDCNADGLFLAFGKERWNVSKEDLRSLWRRFEEWTVRPDQSAHFVPFFEDLNRWGADGDRVIRKTAALLIFARGLVEAAERMRSEDFWGRLQAQVPLRRHFVGKGDLPSYWVEISLAGDVLLFEKEGRVIRLRPEEVRQVWHRFVEWWCLPSPEGEDERTGLDFGRQLGGDAGFYGFELACLMNEMEQSKVFAGRS
jgi:hypothetical protein